MSKIKVYIASPYSDGDKIKDNRALIDNVLRSMEVGNELYELGFAPYLPLLNHFQNQIYPQPSKLWYGLDFEWLDVCDCILRLSGESEGVEKECDYADKMAMPIFLSIDQLLRWRDSRIQP